MIVEAEPERYLQDFVDLLEPGQPLEEFDVVVVLAVVWSVVLGWALARRRAASRRVSASRPSGEQGASG